MNLRFGGCSEAVPIVSEMQVILRPHFFRKKSKILIFDVCASPNEYMIAKAAIVSPKYLFEVL